MTDYTAPTTISTTDLITAAYMNTYWGDNHKHLYEAMNSIIVLEDQKSSGTDGGTATSGSWQTRDLNTEVTDVNSNCSLSSNQFTLDAGTYDIVWRAPAGIAVNRHQSRLQNISDGSTELTGSTARCLDGGTQTDSVGRGRFTIASSKTFEIQHQNESTVATSGFGEAASFTTEVYTTVWLRKVA